MYRVVLLQSRMILSFGMSMVQEQIVLNHWSLTLMTITLFKFSLTTTSKGISLFTINFIIILVMNFQLLTAVIWWLRHLFPQVKLWISIKMSALLLIFLKVYCEGWSSWCNYWSKLLCQAHRGLWENKTGRGIPIK